MFMKAFLIISIQCLCFNSLLCYQLTHLNTKNGLSNDHIKGIAFDQYNYLWIGTENGLNRYNGYQNNIYNISKILNSNQYENRTVSVIPYKDGSVVVPTMYRKYIKAMGNQVTQASFTTDDLFPKYKQNHYDNTEVLIDVFRTAITNNNGSSIIFRKNKASFYRENFEKIADIPAPPTLTLMSKNDYQKHCFAVQNDFYCLDNDFNLYKLVNHRWQFHQNIKLNLLDLNNLHETQINCILSQSVNCVFVQINQALYKFQLDEKNNIQIKKILESITIENPLLTIYKKDINTLVISTSDDGVYIYKGIGTQDMPLFLKSSSELYTLLLNKDTIVNKDLEMYSIQNGNYLGQLKSIDIPTLNCSFVDHFNQLWYLNTENHQLFLKTKNENKPKFIQSELYALNGIFEDSQNRIWILKEEKGLIVMDNTTKVSPKLLLDLEEEGIAEAVCEYKSFVYVLFNSNAILKFPKNGLKFTKQAFGKQQLRMRSLFPLGVDTFLITTYGSGLFVLAKNQLIQLPLDKNKSLSFSHTINLIRDNILLISSNDGLITVKLSDIKQHIKVKSNINYTLFNWFGEYNSEFNGGYFPSSHFSHGKYIFPHTQGIAIFDTSYFFTYTAPLSSINFDELSDIRNKQSFNFNTLQQTATNPLLNFKLSLPYWGNINNLFVEVKTINKKDTTSKYFDQLNFQLDNLNSGQNQLLIKVSDGKHQILQHLTFKVEKKWFEHWYNHLLLILLFVLIYFIGFKFYFLYLKSKNKKLLKLVKEQTKIIEQDKLELFQKNIELENSNKFKDKVVSIITHDLLGPLRFSCKALSSLKNKLNDPNDLYLLDEVQKTNDNVITQSNEVLTWYKLNDSSYIAQFDRIDIYRLIEDLIVIHKPKAKDRQILNKIDPQTFLFSDIVILKMVFGNLIENAIKYGTMEIVISCDIIDNNFIVNVFNSGSNMNPQLQKALNEKDFLTAFVLLQGKTKGGYGLKLCCDLIKLIGGEICFVNTVPNTTLVQVSFPIEIQNA